jgi:hypothetical protein
MGSTGSRTFVRITEELLERRIGACDVENLD